MLKYFYVLIICFPIHIGATSYYINDLGNSGDVFTTSIGSNTNSGLTPSTPKLSLTNLFATYSLGAGDIVYIDAGTYIDDRNFTITASGLTFIGAGYDKTIFDNLTNGTSTDYFMYINASDFSMESLSITNFENQGTQVPGHSGQAITIGGGGTPLTNILFTNVSVYGNGASGGNPAIVVNQDTEVTLHGAGSYCNSPSTAYTGGVEAFGDNITLIIEDYILSGNYKTSFNGGGLRIEGGDNTYVTVTNSRFSDNVANEGGAISQFNGTLRVIDCLFDGNSTSNSGTHYGGAYRIGSGTAHFSRCQFINNTGGGTGCRGGAIGARYVSTGAFSSNKTITIQLDSCIFENNSPGTRGKDVYGANGSSNVCNITGVDCQFLTGGNYNLYSDGTSPASSINVSYFGTIPTSSGSNVTRTLSGNTLYTAAPSPPTYTGTCGSIVLPTEVIDFYSSCNEGNLQFNWKTISEVNNDFFVIEKRTDNAFEEIARIDGNGTTQTITEYSWTDEKTNQSGYYRLSQVDYNGSKHEVSTIFSNYNCASSSTHVYNRNDKLILSNYNSRSNSDITFFLYDASGKIVLNTSGIRTSIDTVESESILRVASGVYFVKVLTNNEEVINQSKIIIIQ